MRAVAGLTALWLLACGRAPAVEQAAHEAVVLHVASSTDQQGPWTNDLVSASSPYLLLHAHNPVDWHPWGTAAFDEARRRDVPVFLSIGYASCHWCRVMEEESFTDPVVAAFLNERFVPVKVDREERPDVDALYSQALRELIGRNGWPASLFVTPDAEPFSGGSYFPDKPRNGKPSFSQAMETALAAWDGDRDELLARSARLRRELEEQALRARGAEIPPESAVAAAVTDLATSHDHVHGGWGSKKFPRAPILELLLDRAALGDEDAVEPLVHALDGMALGGIHDHLAGGFHRYTLDRAWRVPHYEKMLYDNAQLAAVYLDAWRVLGAERYREVGRRTLAWMVAELWSDEAGAFMSSLSADSDGEEGAYYTWTRRDLVRVLGREDGERAAELFRVSGNQPTALSLHNPLPADARPLADALLAARVERSRPDLDDKGVVAWNGLALTALARGLLVDDDEGMRRIARRLAATLIAARREDGTLPRTLGPGAATGVVDDHAFVAEGLLDLYEVDPDPRWLIAAGELGTVLQSRFAVPEGGYWYTAGDDDTLLARQVEWRDGDEPSGLGRATLVTQRLAALGAPGIDGDHVDTTLRRGGPYLARGGGYSFSSLVRTLSSTWRGSFELIVVGRPGAPDTRSLVAVHGLTRRPGMVLGAAPQDGLPAGWSAFSGKVSGPEGARAYLCRQGACEAPTDDPSALAVQVSKALGVPPVAP